MSKIFAESSAVDEVARYWRRFAESATDWPAKYRGDRFFRAEVNVVCLQFAVAIVVTAGIAYVLHSNDISTALRQVMHDHFMVVIAGVTVVMMSLAYAIARITLRPMRDIFTAQKQFIGNIAHELRTPLSIIKTDVEIALLDPDVKEDVRKTMTSNLEELDRISGIINNLLSLSHLVSPGRIEFRAVDCAAAANTAVDTYAELAKRHGVRVSVHAADAVMLWGNEAAVRQIMENLLKNAIMYTPRGGRAEVIIEKPSTQHIRLIVRDTGIGIAHKDLHRIFEPFYRSDSSRVRRHGGSGLGLTIVSELVKLHKGKITVQSTPGTGTKVTVLLPAMHQTKTAMAAPKRDIDETALDFSQQPIGE